MRIVVIGGAGLIGSRLVRLLLDAGHDAVPASRRTGVDIVTGAGVDDVVRDADVIVDVSRSPSMVPRDAARFFTAGTRALLAAGRQSGVGHHLLLSVVGARRMPGAGFLQAKVAQEELVAGSGRPYTVLAATQFYEFALGIANASTVDGLVRLPPAPDQPVAADDVAAELARIAVGPPSNGIVEFAGPDRLRLPEFVAAGLVAAGDPRRVVADPAARYFGAVLTGDELLPGAGARLGGVRYSDWLATR